MELSYMECEKFWSLARERKLARKDTAELCWRLEDFQRNAKRNNVTYLGNHRSFRYYSEAWQSEHHRASCDYSYPICGAWGNQSTIWDNPTTVSLMALYDSGEFCLTVLFDAVASLSNSYLDMDFMGQV